MCVELPGIKVARTRTVSLVKNKGFYNLLRCHVHLYSAGEVTTLLEFMSMERISEIADHLADYISTNLPKVISDPYEIQKLGFDLVNSAKEEILMLFFPPNNAFLREQYSGIIELLKQGVMLRAIRVRILTSKDEQEQIDKLIQEIMIQKGWQQERQARVGKFEIHTVDTRQQQQSLPTNVSILISDSRISMVEELKDYSKDNSNKRISLATYSNSESTVLTYISIFETLWTQAELSYKI